MKVIKGDLFKGEWDAIMHCANLFHIWGAGIVVPLKKLYPEAYMADCNTPKGDPKKLGAFSFADVGQKRIYNLYAQTGIGNDGNPLNRNLRYDYLFDSMVRALHHLYVSPDACANVVATPLIGGGLASGKKSIILSIMEEAFAIYPQFEHHLYEL